MAAFGSEQGKRTLLCGRLRAVLNPSLPFKDRPNEWTGSAKKRTLAERASCCTDMRFYGHASNDVCSFGGETRMDFR